MTGERREPRDPGGEPGDPRLREASDPATPAGRLRQIHEGEPAHGDTEAGLAAMRNPSMDAGCLRLALLDARDGVARSLTLRVAAWCNPSVPLWLIAEPLPDYRRQAARLLDDLGAELDHPVLPLATPASLEALVAAWARPALRPARVARVRAFARHLAGLFGLPWPDEGP